MARRWFGLLAAVLVAFAARAQEAPDTLVRNVTNEVLEIVRKDRDIQAGNTRKAIDLVEAKVLPHFDFAHMTRLAMTREWRNATPAQQKALIEEFRALLVRTYSKALTEYKNQSVEFRPFKMQPGETDVKVRSQIMQSGAKPVPLDYWLEKLDAGWKVYDIEVGGVSLVINYREEFAAEIRKGGIDGLVRTLQAKNRTAEGASTKK